MKEGSIFQFKITLQETEPVIWRRIQISDAYSFWDLHVAIQDSMGWLDYHLHNFEIIDPLTKKKQLMGIPDDEGFDCEKTLSGCEYRIKDYIAANNKMLYLYDYGDNWLHLIEYEGLYIKEVGRKYPICLAGKQACPPEDVGSISGYYNFLDAIKDPSHEDHGAMLEWMGEKIYDPEDFNPEKVKFYNPKARWEHAFRKKTGYN